MANNRTKPSLAENSEYMERSPIAFEGKGEMHLPVSELQTLYAASPEPLREAILAAHWRQRPASLGSAITQLKRRTQGARVTPQRAKRAPSSRKHGDPAPASLSPGQATRLRHHYPFVCALLAEMQRSAS